MRATDLIPAVVSSVCATLLFLRVADNLASLWFGLIIAMLVVLVVKVARRSGEPDRA